MKTFKDSNGKEWQVRLDIATVKRVRDYLDVDLLEPENGKPPLLTKLGTDVILLCDVIYCIVKPQADEAGITDEQFGAVLDGDAILNAQKAFYEELIDFFRRCGRTDQATAIQKLMQVMQESIEKAEKAIQEIDLDSLEASGNSATNLPES